MHHRRQRTARRETMTRQQISSPSKGRASPCDSPNKLRSRAAHGSRTWDRATAAFYL